MFHRGFLEINELKIYNRSYEILNQRNCADTMQESIAPHKDPFRVEHFTTGDSMIFGFHWLQTMPRPTVTEFDGP